MNITPIKPELYGIFSGKNAYHVYPNKDEVYVINHVFFCKEYEGIINFNDNEVKDYKWFEINNLPKTLTSLDVMVLKDLEKYLKDGQVIVS